MTRYRENDDIQSCKCEDAPAHQHCDHECVCMSYYNNAAQKFARPCVLKSPDCKYDTRSRPATSHLSPDDRGWEQGFQDGQTSAIADLNLVRAEAAAQALEEVLNAIKQYSESHRAYRDDGTLAWTSIIVPDHLDELVESLRTGGWK